MGLFDLLIYPIACLIGLFWSTTLCIRELFRILKNGKNYFCSKEFYTYPEELFTGEFSEHKFALLPNGIRLHYVECGKRTDPLMIYIHGFPEFWYSWRHQMLHFKKDYRVVAVDLRGYGLSDKPQAVEHYQVRKLIEDVYHLIHHFGATQCHLVAHDWGGVIAWQFATLHPDMVESLVVMNAPHTLAARKKMTLRQFLMSWYIFFFQLPWLPEYFFSRLGYAMVVDIFSKPPSGMKQSTLSETDKQAFRANFMIPGVCTAAINYYRAMLRYYSQRPRLSRINPVLPSNVPCLLIWGEKDVALSKELADATAQLIPHCKVRFIPGASHWVQQDTPELVNNAMDAFYNDQ